MDQSLAQNIECKNCGNHYIGDFCNHCGQRRKTQRINFLFLVNELQNSVVRFDRGMIFNLKKFLLKPGHRIREYLEGKRANYMKPVTFLFWMSLFYFFLSRTIPVDTPFEEFLISFKEGYQEKNTSGVFSGLEWMVNNYAYSILIIVPVFSLASYLAFFKAKLNFFEHLVSNSFIFAEITFFFVILIPFHFIGVNDLYQDISMFFAAFFLIMGYYQLFKIKNKFVFFVQILLCFLLFLILLGVLLYLIVTGTALLSGQ